MLHRTAAAAATPLRRAALARQATWRTAHGAVAAAHRSHHRYRSDSAAAADPPPAAAVPRILVLGGNGFVGNAVCEAALSAGMAVSSISRSGRPAWFKEDSPADGTQWISEVTWHSGSVFEPEDLAAAIGDGDEKVTAVVSCIGAFGSTEFMLKMNGGATITAVEAASAAGVPRFVFVSAHDYGMPVTSLVSGYYDGKYNAERAIEEAYGPAGVILRAPAVSGRRTLPSGSVVPVDLIGGPQRAVANLLPTALWSIPLANVMLVPWVTVTEVGQVAAMAAAPDSQISGRIPVDRMIELAAAV